MNHHPIVLGTAGHIDHGKTSLVHALTGIDTDRLAVEKQRGITTELGFARLDLDGRRIAVVDVPGHERFVKSMVAGATGLDLVVLVIAADEGVMPQTREHLAICDLLGVRRGIVALAKVDLVDDDWRALVESDVRATLAGTFLAGAPIVGTSTKRPETLEDLKRAIATIVDALPPRPTGGVLRLPIDRVFTMKGFGTVVTGTLLGGELAIGDELAVIPSGIATRVRGLQVHGTEVERAGAGLRVAVNLTNVGVDELARGELIVHPGRVAGSHILDVELAGMPAPTARMKVLVHHAASCTLATLVPVEGMLAQLRVDARTPIGALPGDRFVLRMGGTLGGGRVIRALAPKARGDEHAAVVGQLATARDEHRVALEVKTAAAAGLTLDDLERRLGIPRSALEPLVASGELLHVEPHYVHAATVAALEQKLLAAIPMPKEALRGTLPAALPARVFDAILAGLAARKLLLLADDRVAKYEAAKAPLSAADQALADRVRGFGVEPPKPTEFDQAALARLISAKRLVKVKPDLVMHADVVSEIRTKLLAHLEAHGTIDPTQWKALTGASRKYTIPLAEYFDAEKLTLRVGDLRRRR